MSIDLANVQDRDELTLLSTSCWYVGEPSANQINMLTTFLIDAERCVVSLRRPSLLCVYCKEKQENFSFLVILPTKNRLTTVT